MLSLGLTINESMHSCFAAVKLNGGRHVQGILRGFDPFMNLVVDETLEMGPGGQQSSIGMVVSTSVPRTFMAAHERRSGHSIPAVWND